MQKKNKDDKQPDSGMEQAPELDEEDEAILDDVWDQIDAEDGDDGGPG